MYQIFPTNTYKQGIERLNILKIQEFAYSSDPDISVEEKNAIIEKQLREIDPFYYLDMEGILTVPKLTETVVTASMETISDPLAVIGYYFCLYMYFIIF